MCVVEGNHYDHAFLEAGKWTIWTIMPPPKVSSRKDPPIKEMNAAVRDIKDDIKKNSVGPSQWHSGTSKQAALDNYPQSGTQRFKVLLYLAGQSDGATDHEIVEALDLSPSSVRPRRGELVNGGYVEDSGRERPTPHDSTATVWVVTDEGRQVAQNA
jgi:hypothetical protein